MAEYIEREALIKRICEEKCRTEYGKCQKGKHDDKIILCVCDFIRFQPAADVAPVKHGKWGAYEAFPLTASLNGHPCSECGMRFSTSQIVFMNYCPNCGARMDQEDLE